MDKFRELNLVLEMKKHRNEMRSFDWLKWSRELHEWVEQGLKHHKLNSSVFGSVPTPHRYKERRIDK